MRILPLIGKWVVSLCVILHLVVLFLNNLPWSPFIQQLYPHYSWYPEGSGQIQGWGMYRFPQHADSRYQVIAHYAGGQTSLLKESFTISDRELYFLEALFFYNNGGTFASAYLDILHKRMNEFPKPIAIEVVRKTHSLPVFSTTTSPLLRKRFREVGKFRKDFP